MCRGWRHFPIITPVHLSACRKPPSQKPVRRALTVYLEADLLAAIEAERARIEAETGLKVGKGQVATRAMRAGFKAAAGR